MYRLLTIIFLLCSLNTMANDVEIFYSGFWSHSPFPTKIDTLIESHHLYLSVQKQSIPNKFQDTLFKGYSLNKEHSTGIDYIFYLKEIDENGKVLRELGGGNEILFDLNNNTFKRLTEEEKIQLNNYIKNISFIKSDFLPYRTVEKNITS